MLYPLPYCVRQAARQAGIGEEKAKELAAVILLLLATEGEEALHTAEVPGFAETEPVWLTMSEFWWLPEPEAV